MSLAQVSYRSPALLHPHWEPLLNKWVLLSPAVGFPFPPLLPCLIPVTGEHWETSIVGQHKGENGVKLISSPVNFQLEAWRDLGTIKTTEKHLLISVA